MIIMRLIILELITKVVILAISYIVLLIIDFGL
jgi:hypothetical protein